MSDMLTDIGRTPERPLRSATVLSVSNGRAKIELATGSVIPDALLVGGVSVGQSVRVAYQGGQYIVYGSAAEAAPSVSVAGTISGGTGAGGAPTPHDWLGIHHTLPSGAAGLFAATPSGSSGTVSMRGIVLSDIQAAADSRYSLASRTITAGAGLTGGGDLTASRTLNVGQGDGVAVDADVVRVRRATTSGLSFSGGGLAVGAGNGISVLTDTVAVNQAYAFTWSAAHTFSARPTFSAGATISAGQTLRIGSGSGDVDLSRKASDVLALGSGDAMESTSYQSGVSGWRIDAAGAAEFSNVRVRGEFTASVFKVNEVSATAGTFGAYYSASTVYGSFTTPAINAGVDVSAADSDDGAMLFSVNDILQVKTWTGSAMANVWLVVVSRTQFTGYTRYSCTMKSGAVGVVINAGAAIVDWGPSGSGAVTLSADGTIGASANLSVVSHSGSPWSATTLRARVGNLNGSYGYSTNVYGFAAGDNATTFVAVDPDNGFRVRRDATTRFQVDTSGVLTICNTSGVAVITMDSTSARIDNVLQIGTSGEIRQGTGTWSSTFTGTRIWNDAGVGRIGGYNAGVLQWYANNSGTLKAGGGDVTLDSDGISLVSWAASRGSIGSANGYRFSAASTTFCGLYASTNTTVETALSLLNYGVTQPSIVIEAQDTSTIGGSASSVTLIASGPSYSQSIVLNQAGLAVNQLNVGSATGATTGQVRAHELYLGTGSDVRLYRGAADTLRTPDAFTVDDVLTASNGINAAGAFQSQLVVGGPSAAGFAGSIAFRRGSAGAAISAYVGFSGASEAANFESRVTGGGSFFSWSANVSGVGQTEVMRVSNAGRLGIGTASPGYLLDVAGDVNGTGVYRRSGTQVVGARVTGWAAATGTATRTTFATGTVTTAQLAERVKALIDDLTTHGLIGA